MSRPDRILLLSGTPPGAGNVGEIVLRDIVLHVGSDRVSVVAVTAVGYAWTRDPRLSHLDVRFLHSSQIRSVRRGTGKLSALGSFVNSLTTMRRDADVLAGEIVASARPHGFGKILAVLDNPLMMMIAHRVANALGLQMTALVWDSPDYLLSRYGFDRFSRRYLVNEFNKSLSASQRVAVVSEAMLLEYGSRTRAPVHLLRHGIAMAFAGGDATGPSFDDPEWLIGFAGSMYSECAWRAFLSALDDANWTIAGRPVRLKLITPSIALASRKQARVDYLGCMPEAEDAQALLARCHLNYLPQPFSAQLRDLSRFSFPTKLTSYLATGRPVLVHSPPGASLSEFYADNPIGVHSTTLQPSSILRDIEELLSSRAAYDRACRQVRTTALAHFDLPVFHSAIDRAIAGAVPEAAGS